MSTDNREDEDFEISDKLKRKEKFSQKSKKHNSRKEINTKFKLFSKGRKNRPSTKDLLDFGEDDE